MRHIHAYKEKSTVGVYLATQRPTARLTRQLHDFQATLLSAIGKSAQQLTSHPRAKVNIDVVSKASSPRLRGVESLYYSDQQSSSGIQPKCSLYQLNDVWVTGAQGHLFLERNAYLHVCRSFDGITDKKIRRPIPWLAETIEEPVFVLMGRGLGNRGHFLVEHMPRYIACRDHLPTGTKIMVPPGQKKWAAEYLGKLGVPPDRIIEGSHGTVLLKQAFYMPLFSGDDKARLAPKPLYEQIREAFIPASTAEVKRYVFITRKDAPSRIMLNEDDIFAAAQKQFPKLERVSMGSLSLDEQVALFSDAAVVIGAHNQAFRNLLFCSDALCIQLVNGDRTEANEYYFWADNYSQLGAMFGNDCIALYSETPLDDDWNWSYPVEKFNQDLDRVIELRK
jgi:capsular polysaccharide biosynthesis protein